MLKRTLPLILWSLCSSLTAQPWINPAGLFPLTKLKALGTDAESVLFLRNIVHDQSREETKAPRDVRVTASNKDILRLQGRKEKVLYQSDQGEQWIQWIIGLTLGGTFFSLLFSYRMRRKHRITTLKMLENEHKTQNLFLKNQRLEMELEASNKALAAENMRKLKHNSLINHIITDLQQHSRKVRPDTREILKSVVNELNTILEEDSWKEFDIRFQQVDQRFYDKLAESYPSLTQGERRVCAFLRLDMSSKEISAITGQSLRAVELARTRIRKKLGMTNSEVNLSHFLSQL